MKNFNDDFVTLYEPLNGRILNLIKRFTGKELINIGSAADICEEEQISPENLRLK